MRFLTLTRRTHCYFSDKVAQSGSWTTSLPSESGSKKRLQTLASTNQELATTEVRERKNRLPLEEFTLSDSEAEAILSYMGDGIKVDLEKVYIRVPKRQLGYAATLASNYDENYKKVEKSIVSRKVIRKSQEKPPVSLSWREIIKGEKMRCRGIMKVDSENMAVGSCCPYCFRHCWSE